MYCRVFYIIENLLQRRCLKWACMTHLDISNTSYGQKKGRPLKVRNCFNFLVCKWRVIYYWKDLDKGYNFASSLTSIGGLHTKLQASKVARVPILGISGLPLGSAGTKWHLGVGPWPCIEYTIRGNVVASPKSGPWWILCVRVYLWLVHAPKVFQLRTNQLVVWFVQVCVNN